jgi:hypothetical protein
MKLRLLVHVQLLVISALILAGIAVVNSSLSAADPSPSPTVATAPPPTRTMTLDEQWRDCINDPTGWTDCPTERDYPQDPDYYYPEPTLPDDRP